MKVLKSALSFVSINALALALLGASVGLLQSGCSRQTTKSEASKTETIVSNSDKGREYIWALAKKDLIEKDHSYQCWYSVTTPDMSDILPTSPAYKALLAKSQPVKSQYVDSVDLYQTLNGTDTTIKTSLLLLTVFAAGGCTLITAGVGAPWCVGGGILLASAGTFSSHTGSDVSFGAQTAKDAIVFNPQNTTNEIVAKSQNATNFLKMGLGKTQPASNMRAGKKPVACPDAVTALQLTQAKPSVLPETKPPVVNDPHPLAMGLVD